MYESSFFGDLPNIERMTSTMTLEFLVDEEEFVDVVVKVQRLSHPKGRRYVVEFASTKRLDIIEISGWTGVCTFYECAA